MGADSVRKKLGSNGESLQFYGTVIIRDNVGDILHTNDVLLRGNGKAIFSMNTKNYSNVRIVINKNACLLNTYIWR